MKVSVITATFNSAIGISECLESILTQDYKNIECIIIDGNSNDQTLEIIAEKQDEYSNIYLFSEADHGIYDALNKGINKANGDIICFVHSDDILKSNSILDKIVNLIKNENYDGVYGDLNYVKKTNTNKIIRNWKSSGFHPSLLRKGWMPPHPTLFLKKEVYEKHGFFDLSYSISADYDFILRIFKDQELKFGYLPTVITNMRVGGASNRSIKNIIKKSKEDYIAIKRNNVGNIITLIRKNTSKIKQFF